MVGCPLHVIHFLQEEEVSSSVSELSLENVGGIFLVLLLGLIAGGMVAVIEYIATVCCKKRKFI